MSGGTALAERSPDPLVSVVLPAFNGGRTILATLESLSKQGYSRIEWIVVDDGSADATARLVDEFIRSRGVPARLLRHVANQGLSRTLNDGIAAATGDFVLILHQDVELVGSDWVTRAVSYMLEDERVMVVTCYYGIPAPDDLNFVKRSFGFLRRQFHRPPQRTREFVTFTEFKSDLIRKQVLEAFGGFATRFRICGEDIMLSYRIRRAGGLILKAYDLRTIQRFGGKAETLAGNLSKEFRFGECIVGALVAFRSYAFRDLDRSPYARARSLHRASQPIVALVGLLLVVLSVVPAWVIAQFLLILLVGGRYAFYVARLWPEFRAALPKLPRAVEETLGAALIGLLSDMVYPAGMLTGLVRAAYGAPL